MKKTASKKIIVKGKNKLTPAAMPCTMLYN